MYTDRTSLVVGTIYRLRSRNLDVGVYDGAGTFVGIRTKFGTRYLDVEYLADEHGGTVVPGEVLGAVPSGIAVTAGTFDDGFSGWVENHRLFAVLERYQS